MNAKVYSLADGMNRIDVSENNQKNYLAIGTVLELNGYSNPKYAIVENNGINQNFPGYGSTYTTVNLADKTFSKHEAYTLKYLSEKKDDRIQMYITKTILSTDEVIELWKAAKENQKNDQQRKEQAEKEKVDLTVKKYIGDK